MMRKKKSLKGSFTVEAALLSSVFLSVLIFLFFWCLMMYNRTILQVYAVRGAKQIFYYTGTQNAEAAKVGENIALQGVSGKCVGTGEIESEVSVGKKNVSVSLSGVQESVSLLPPGLTDESIWEMELKWEEKRGRPADVYRETRKYLLYGKLIREFMKESEK